jgi:hypothetical protein
MEKELRDLTKNSTLTDKTDEFPKESQLLVLIQALDQKIKNFEAKQTTHDQASTGGCAYSGICFTAKAKSGTCPCELYR